MVGKFAVGVNPLPRENQTKSRAFLHGCVGNGVLNLANRAGWQQIAGDNDS